MTAATEDVEPTEQRQMILHPIYHGKVPTSVKSVIQALTTQIFTASDISGSIQRVKIGVTSPVGKNLNSVTRASPINATSISSGQSQKGFCAVPHCNKTP